MDENLVSQFDNYLKGKLSPEEIAAFDLRLKEDLEYQQSFNVYKQTVGLVNKKAFLEDISIVLEQEKTQSFSNGGIKQKLILSGIAASVLLLITVSIFVLYNRQQQPEFATLFKPYPNILLKRVTKYDDLELALKKYSAGEFESSIELMSQLKPQSDTVRFYIGISLLTLNRIDESIISLKSIPENSIFYGQSNWYLALAYLGLKADQQCVSYLKKIQKGEFKYSEAQDLIAILE